MVADKPREKLSELVGRYGPGLGRDARQCKALLADVCGNEYRAECAVLVAAVDEGVAGELFDRASGLPTEVLLGRLSDRLHANRGVADELARWSVETWAVALGVTAGGPALAKFKMDGLVPLIDLAGADGTIAEAEFDHLIAEAKTRGVSEADARAYLSAYAVAHGWQVGSPQRRRQRAPASPPPSPQSLPQPQPAQPAPIPQPAPDGTFRYALAGVAALAAIAVAVTIVRVKPQPQPPPQASTPPAAALVPTRVPPPTPSPSSDQADREQRAYNAARGNAAALQGYMNSCIVCTYAPAARSEIAKLETADQEERTYNTSRGNKYALQAYINICTVCTYAAAARAEIAAAQTKRVASSTIICGRSIDYLIDATGVPDQYRSFLGVWTGAAWNSRICGGLIVQSVDGDGSARVTYVYGPLRGAQFLWKQQSPISIIRSSQLTFQDEENGNFTFRLNQLNILQGHFTSARGVSLDAVLTRDMSSVPQ